MVVGELLGVCWGFDGKGVENGFALDSLGFPMDRNLEGWHWMAKVRLLIDLLGNPLLP